MSFIKETEKESNKQRKKKKTTKESILSKKMADYTYSCSAFGPQTSRILKLYMQSRQAVTGMAVPGNCFGVWIIS